MTQGSSAPREPSKRHGIPAARSNLWVAQLAKERYFSCADDQAYDKMLYYGAFFLFCRSALDALRKSDGPRDGYVQAVQTEFYQERISGSDIFRLLKGERDRIGHGSDDWSAHPFLPESLLIRAQGEGLSWEDVVFDGAWVGGSLQGRPVNDVMNIVWRTVSGWLDDIDAEAYRRHAQAQL